MKSTDEFDEQLMKEIWDEALKQEDAFRAELKRKRDRIFKAIRGIKGDAFVSDLEGAMTDWVASGDVNLVRRVSGQWQKDNYGSFKDYCVDQYSSGDSGDCFYGWVYVEVRKESPTKPALYIQIHYAC